jgi:hypothetical protein
MTVSFPAGPLDGGGPREGTARGAFSGAASVDRGPELGLTSAGCGDGAIAAAAGPVTALVGCTGWT